MELIEETIVAYLKSTLSCKVALEKPSPEPSEYVRVERTGGGYKEHISSAVFAIQSYAQSLYEAAALNDLVKAAMLEIVTKDRICKIELNSDYNFTDLSKKKYRYQAVFNIKYY